MSSYRALIIQTKKFHKIEIWEWRVIKNNWRLYKDINRNYCRTLQFVKTKFENLNLTWMKLQWVRLCYWHLISEKFWRFSKVNREEKIRNN